MSKDTKNKDLFAEENKVSFAYAPFEKIGDKCQGVYVGKFESFSDKYGPQTFENYILMQEDGTQLVVRGRATDKKTGTKVIFGMERIPLGAVMGFIFDREYDSGKGNPAKIVEPRYAGEKDMDVLSAFQDKYELDSFAEDEAQESAEPAEMDSVPESF